MITVVARADDRSDKGIQQAFIHAQRFVTAIRIAANAKIPPLTWERLAGVGLRLKIVGGRFEVAEMTPLLPLSELTEPLSDKQLEQAHDWFEAGAGDHPTELFRDLKLRALTALSTGDGMVAVVMAAAATEVLLEQTARMLIWERLRQGGVELWLTIPKPLRSMYPNMWRDHVLQPALGGAWADSKEWKAWSRQTRDIRNQVMHEGLRVGPDEAEAAVDGLLELERFVADRIFANAHSFPVVAVNTVGLEGFERRGGSLADFNALGGEEQIGLPQIRAYRDWDGPEVESKPKNPHGNKASGE